MKRTVITVVGRRGRIIAKICTYLANSINILDIQTIVQEF